MPIIEDGTWRVQTNKQVESCTTYSRIMLPLLLNVATAVAWSGESSRTFELSGSVPSGSGDTDGSAAFDDDDHHHHAANMSNMFSNQSQDLLARFKVCFNLTIIDAFKAQSDTHDGMQDFLEDWLWHCW